MKTWIINLLAAIIFILIGWFAHVAWNLPKNASPISQLKPTPLYKYDIENLAAKYPSMEPSQIEVGDIIKNYPKFTSYKFSMKFSPDFSDNSKTVSGVINIPHTKSPFPVIVMFRGYIDQTKYSPGEGTQPSASVFAANGYITIAPDFLGYGTSDAQANDIFESRFQTYVTAMATLKSVSTIKDWDHKNIFIWGHSNGGQITLTTLEATGVKFPTVLWAPVSMPFPGSILYYSFEADDQGKYIVDRLSKFNDIYDATKFSLTNYLSFIKAPIQLNQGTNDVEVPYWISDSLEKDLKEATVSAVYIKYQGADHNMQPAWNKTIQNNLNFFKDHLVF